VKDWICGIKAFSKCRTAFGTLSLIEVIDYISTSKFFEVII